MTQQPADERPETGSRAGGLRKRFSWFIVLLLALDLALRLWGASRPIADLDDVTIPDDAYLSLTIARNLGHGLGPLYGAAPTSGFQPLYVLLMAPVYTLAREQTYFPIHCSLWLLSVADVVALGLLLAWVGRHVRRRGPLLLLAAGWIFSSYLLEATLDGLEAMLAIASLIGLFSWLDGLTRGERAEQPKAWKWGMLGLLLGVALLARVDAALTAPLLGCAFVWKARRWNWETRLRCAGAACAGFVILYLPWLLWLHAWTGDFFPISGRAVHQLAAAKAGAKPGLTVMQANDFWMTRDALTKRDLMLWRVALGLIGINFIVGLRSANHGAGGRIEQGARHVIYGLAPAVWFMLFAAILIPAYMLFISTYWYYERYFLPSVVVLLLVVGLGSEQLMQALPRRSGNWLCGGLVLLMLGCGLADEKFRAIYTHTDEKQLGYMPLGLWANGAFPAGTRIGSTQTGALGYFADRMKIYNLDGVVNKAAYEAIRERRLLQFMRGEKIEYFLDWAQQTGIVSGNSAGYRAGDLQEIQAVEGFLSWKARWLLYKVRPGD